jgi:hypothetical protein
MIYEKRTYSVMVGRMPEVIKLYEEEGWAALEGGGFSAKLIGYFISDTGPLHQIIHLWRFDDDADRRDFYKRLFSDDAFMAFATQLRPLFLSQEVQLMTSAPWGPTP